VAVAPESFPQSTMTTLDVVIFDSSAFMFDLKRLHMSQCE